MKGAGSSEGLGWGILLLVLLIGSYVAALAQIAPSIETGVRVIPWQAPDLEIPSPATENRPPES